MRRGLLTVAITLLAAAPAHAGWSAPRVFWPGEDSSATAAVAADGTTVSTWHDRNGGVARVGNGRPIQVSAGFDLRTVATAHGAFVGWTVGPNRSVVARALPHGLLGPPVRVGGGSLTGLAANARGDVAAVTETSPYDGSFTQTAFRPAGGIFGPPATLPPTQVSAFALSPRGETLVGISDPGAVQGVALGFDVSTRSGGGPVTTTPFDGNNGGTMDGAAIGGDAHGGVLAVWAAGFRNGFFTSVRSAAGVWSAPVFQPVDESLGAFSTVVTRDGHAVIAWRDGSGRARYTAGTTASAAFAPPRTVGATHAGPQLLALRDGRVALAYADGAFVRVSIARPGQRFPAGQAAACDADNQTYAFAGELRGGSPVLRAGSSLVHEIAGHAHPEC